MTGRCKISDWRPKICHHCHNLLANWLLFVASMVMVECFCLKDLERTWKEAPRAETMRPNYFQSRSSASLFVSIAQLIFCRKFIAFCSTWAGSRMTLQKKATSQSTPLLATPKRCGVFECDRISHLSRKANVHLKCLIRIQASNESQIRLTENFLFACLAVTSWLSHKLIYSRSEGEPRSNKLNDSFSSLHSTHLPLIQVGRACDFRCEKGTCN